MRCLASRTRAVNVEASGAWLAGLTAAHEARDSEEHKIFRFDPEIEAQRRRERVVGPGLIARVRHGSSEPAVGDAVRRERGAIAAGRIAWTFDLAAAAGANVISRAYPAGSPPWTEGARQAGTAGHGAGNVDCSGTWWAGRARVGRQPEEAFRTC